LSKKQKHAKPEHIPTQHHISRLQRQTRTRRVITIISAVFLAVLIGWVSYGYYNDNVKPLHKIAIEVNQTSFDVGYYIEALDAYTKNYDPDQINYMVGLAASQIVQNELIRQGADSLGIYVTDHEVKEKVKENNLPDNKVYQDIIRAGLLKGKLLEYFELLLPDTMEQAHIQAMLVESIQVANEVLAKIESSGDFTSLLGEYSCQPQIQGDLGWLPQELMPNTLIGEAAFNLEPGKVDKIYDKTASKDIGYWLIEVTDKDDEKGINARAILLGSMEDVDEVKTRLASENFTSLAEEYSQHESKANGGELGWLKQGDMNSGVFDEVAFSLPLNEVSDPVQDKSVQTTGGYWIVKVLAREDRELDEQASIGLAQIDLNDWYLVQRESSTINDYLDENTMLMAIDRVTERR